MKQEEQQKILRLSLTVYTFTRLQDEGGMYNTHGLFLLCISGNIIPNGQRLELETGNGNYNEKFFIDWYNKPSKTFLHDQRDAIKFFKKKMIS